MPKIDNQTLTDVRVAMVPLAITATKTDNPILDTKRIRGVQLVVVAGALTAADATNYIANVIEEGDNSALSDAAAVAMADLIVDGDPAASAVSRINDLAQAGTVISRISYIGNKRYLRFKPTETGTFDGLVSATWVLTELDEMPV